MELVSLITVMKGTDPKFDIRKGVLQSSYKYIKVHEDTVSTTYEVKMPKQTFTDRALQFLSPLCFWCVSAAKAIRIIMQHTGRPRECIRLYSTCQDRWYLYRNWSEPCWYAEVEKDEMLLAGTYIVGVSRKTGKIVVKDRANDEG